MRGVRILTGVLLGIVCVLPGCLTTGEADSMKMSIATLQMQSDDQRREIADLKSRIDQLAQDVNSVGAIKENQSSVLTRTQDFSQELQALQGKFEESRYQNDKALKDIAADREAMNVKISALEAEMLKAKTAAPQDKKTAATAVVVPAAGNVPATAAAGADQPPAKEASEPQELYDKAQAELKEKKYAEARETLEKFLKAYPKHKLSVSARFWLGESYFGEKKYGDAIVEFEDVWQKNPKHEKARVAMLKEGQAFYETKDCRAAKVILQKLSEKYPQSDEAKLGEKKITEIAGDKACYPKPTKKKTTKKKAAAKKKTSTQ